MVVTRRVATKQTKSVFHSAKPFGLKSLELSMSNGIDFTSVEQMQLNWSIDSVSVRSR